MAQTAKQKLEADKKNKKDKMPHNQYGKGPAAKKLEKDAKKK